VTEDAPTSPAGAAAPGAGAASAVVELTLHPSPHPFVRRGIVARAPKIPTGSLVTLRSPEGVILGDGFWNSASDIAVRRLTSGDVRFDAGVLEAALDRAATLRESLPDLAKETDAWRAVHSEGDGLSGLIVDRLGEVVAVELHSAGWIGWLDVLLPMLQRRLGTAHHRVSMGERTARLEGVAPLERSSEGCPRNLRIREQGVRYRVDLESGHKTGFFCDQRDNRRDFARWATGDVLDLCCYTGGFAASVAVAGRAASITAVDLDEDALATARENLNLNQARAQLVHADAFDWLRQVAAAGRRFDSIVLDPPKFIPSRRDELTGRGKYHDLNRLAFSVLKPGGLLLTSSCSGLLSRVEFTELVTTAARKSGRAARLLRSTGAAPDHPVLLECPETEYLKCLWLRAW
jgi:23S rRNA (cytosine1962-C5)-methyltransferase